MLFEINSSVQHPEEALMLLDTYVGRSARVEVREYGPALGSLPRVRILAAGVVQSVRWLSDSLIMVRVDGDEVPVHTAWPVFERVHRYTVV